ncbi:MAG: hypothetical protein QF537_20435, partial [SAR324 cluster bacterium]|nr:hypothetical protein [SAR324 cluster bacterium]
KYFENVFTSGEAAHKHLVNELDKQKFFHIGPPRDFDLFKNFEKNKVLNIEDADYLLCTGLFDDHESDLNYYKNLLKKYKIKFALTTRVGSINKKNIKKAIVALHKEFNLEK